MFRKFASAGLMLAMAASATVQAQPMLFKDYAYDSPKSTYTKAKGYEDCSDFIGKPALCRDGVSFLGEAFSEALIFNKGKLRMVTLYAPETDGMVEKVVLALNENFLMTIFTSGKKQLDLVKLARTAKNREEMARKLAAFQGKAVESGTYSATFLEKFELPKNKPEDVVQLMMIAPDDLRVAEMNVLADEDDSTVMVRFGYPKLDSKANAAQVKASKEAF
ncbi:hypothetical protein [Pseudomonas sp. NPDC089406]|uniref:hypothetical protein n=1 Tax=Pseudomonas sp. NPDC089406 TaxID=3364463 RepID=UPI00384EDD31